MSNPNAIPTHEGYPKNLGSMEGAGSETKTRSQKNTNPLNEGSSEIGIRSSTRLRKSSSSQSIDLNTERSFMQRTGSATPPASSSHVNMDFGTPRSNIATPAHAYDRNTSECHNSNSVVTPRPDFSSPPTNNNYYAPSSQFIGNNQFSHVAPENQAHSFNQGNYNNFMGPGYFVQQPDNMNGYYLGQNAMTMSSNYTTYQASQDYYWHINQMQMNTNYGQPNYFSYQQSPQGSGKNNEMNRYLQLPSSYSGLHNAQGYNVKIKDPRLKRRESEVQNANNTPGMDTRDSRLSKFRLSDFNICHNAGGFGVQSPKIPEKKFHIIRNQKTTKEKRSRIETQTSANAKEPDENRPISVGASENNLVEEGTKIAVEKNQIETVSSSNDNSESYLPQPILVDQRIDQVSSAEASKEPEVESNEALEANDTASNQEATSGKDSPTEILQMINDIWDQHNNQDKSAKTDSLIKKLINKLDFPERQKLLNILRQDETNKSNEASKEQQIASTTVVENNNIVENEHSTTHTNETRVNEVTETMVHSDMEVPLIEEQRNKEYLDLEPVVVSVAERTKSRKQASQVEIAQKELELDLPQADIRDEVLLSTTTPSLEESNVTKNRGYKRKVIRNNCNNPEISLPKQIKEIPKMIPPAEYVSYIYSESELKKGPLKEFEETHKRTRGRRKSAKCASGLISKPRKKKPQKLKSKESSSVRSTFVASETVSLSHIDMTEILVQPDIDYYYDYTTKSKLTCKLCPYNGHLITVHYLRKHPESEVLASRLPPHAAAEAIQDYVLNEETFKNVTNKKSSKFNYSCRMCGYAGFFPPYYFYDHVTSHTGEHQHKCGRCEYTAASEQAMIAHYQTFHPYVNKNEKAPIKRFKFAIVFGYMCKKCNFVQLKKESVQNHIQICHSDDESTIHKINMSTIIDLQLTNVEGSDINIKDSRPSPRSNTMLVSQIDNANLSDEAAALTSTHFSEIEKVSVTEEKTQESETLRSKSRAARAPSSKDVVPPARKRSGRIARLINKRNKDDLGAIITRKSSRAAKEKATAKLKSLMESEESNPIINCRSNQEPPMDSYENEFIGIESIKEELDEETDATIVGWSSATSTNEISPLIFESKSSEKVLNIFNSNMELSIQDEASNGDLKPEISESIGDLVRASGSEKLYSCQKDKCNYTSKNEIVLKSHYKTFHGNSQATSLDDSDPSHTSSPVEPASAAITLIPTLAKNAAQSEIIIETKLTSFEASRPRKEAKILESLIKTPNNLYKCPHFLCKFSSNVRAIFDLHLKEHVSDNTHIALPCVYCDVKTPWNHLSTHIENRHGASRHTCKYCLYRAVAPEYVCLHLLQCHRNDEYVVISVPPHEAANTVSAANMEINWKQLCEPYRCVCKNKDGQLKTHKYLFQNEFANHLLRFHNQKHVQCGYPGCIQDFDPISMIVHWETIHKIYIYQCSYCKVNTREHRIMYRHFAREHPNLMPKYFIRESPYLSKHSEVGFTDEAYQYVGHIKGFPANLIDLVKNQSEHQTIKIIELDASNATEEPTTTST